MHCAHVLGQKRGVCCTGLHLHIFLVHGAPSIRAVAGGGGGCWICASVGVFTSLCPLVQQCLTLFQIVEGVEHLCRFSVMVCVHIVRRGGMM